MNGTRSIWMLTAFISFLAIRPAEAQSLLQRLSEQLNPQRSPAASEETLPPPREATAAEATAAEASPRASSGNRAALGIRVGPVTEEVIREQQLIVRRGAVITAIDVGSAADRAGLPLGAVIVAVHGRRVDSPEELVAAVQTAPPGKDVELTYYDGKKLVRKKVHLAAGPALDAVAVPKGTNRVPPPLPAPVPAPAAAPATPPTPSVERAIGAGGSRPLLGRIGRVIDSFATQAQAVAPVAPVAPVEPVATEPISEVAELRQQLASLASEVAALRKQVAALEKKLSNKN